VNSHTSSMSTVTASARAAASASDCMRKRRTTSPPYRAHDDVGGVEAAMGDLAFVGRTFHSSRMTRSRQYAHRPWSCWVRGTSGGGWKGREGYGWGWNEGSAGWAGKAMAHARGMTPGRSTMRWRRCRMSVLSGRGFPSSGNPSWHAWVNYAAIARPPGLDGGDPKRDQTGRGRWWQSRLEDCDRYGT
jgi:hypothetical protein